MGREGAGLTVVGLLRAYVNCVPFVASPWWCRVGPSMNGRCNGGLGGVGSLFPLLLLLLLLLTCLPIFPHCPS
jgi:hypothetical protein